MDSYMEGEEGWGGGGGFLLPEPLLPPSKRHRIQHMFALRVHSVKKAVTTALITHNITYYE